jgi:predicted dehydrogenase
MRKHTLVRIGVVGLGHQSLEDHIPAIKACRDIEFVAVADIDEVKLKSFLAENKSINGYLSAEELFKKEKLDIVIIALPHHLHHEVTKLAISYKINVLKEKPFAISLEQGKEIRDLALKNNVHVSVTLQRRFNPIYTTLFQLIDKIGDLFYVEGKYTIFTDSPHDGWRGRKDLAGGGCIIDMGYHMIDLLIWYFGLPDKIFANASCNAKENIDYDAEDTAQIMFEYNKTNVWGSLLLSRVIPPKQEYLNIFGTRGYIHLERGKIERFSSNGVSQESLMRENSWPSAFQDQIEYFVKVIKNEKENIGSPEYHLNHLALIEASYKSLGTKCAVNPKDLLI